MKTKIDKQARQTMEIEKIAIYYFEKQAIIIGDERKGTVVALHSLAVLARPGNKKPYQICCMLLKALKT